MDNKLIHQQLTYVSSKNFMMLEDFLEVFKGSGVPVLENRTRAIPLIKKILKALEGKYSDDKYYIEMKNKRTGKISFLMTKSGINFYFWNLPNSDKAFGYQIMTTEIVCDKLEAAKKAAWESNPEGMQALNDWATTDGSSTGLKLVLIKHGRK